MFTAEGSVLMYGKAVIYGRFFVGFGSVILHHPFFTSNTPDSRVRTPREPPGKKQAAILCFSVIGYKYTLDF
jgi:hypothetical protein